MVKVCCSFVVPPMLNPNGVTHPSLYEVYLVTMVGLSQQKRLSCLIKINNGKKVDRKRPEETT